MSWLSGKKTYIVGALMFIIGGLHAIKDMIPVLSSISDETWKSVMSFVSVGGLGAALAFLRSGVNKAES